MWRYGVKATFYSIAHDVQKAEEYWQFLEDFRFDDQEFTELILTVDDPLRRLDMKMFASVTGALKGEVGNRILKLVQTKVRFGSGRQLMAILDHYYVTEKTAKSRKAAEKIIKLRCDKARDLEEYMTTFRNYVQIMAATSEPIADGMAVGLLRTQLSQCGLVSAPMGAFAMLPQEEQKADRLMELLERLVHHYK